MNPNVRVVWLVCLLHFHASIRALVYFRKNKARLKNHNKQKLISEGSHNLLAEKNNTKHAEAAKLYKIGDDSN